MSDLHPLESVFAAQRQHFPALRTSGYVHLNNAAGSELPASAVEAMSRWMLENFSNEGAVFPRLERATALSAQARARTADLLGADAAEIGFGPSTTNNLFSISRALARRWRPGDRVFVSEACHEANIAPWLALRDQGIDVAFVPMRGDTHLDYEHLERNIDARTRLVSIGASSNVTGTSHDVDRVVRIARSVGALVSLDAAHFAAHRPIDVRALDVDLLFFSLYKCFGPHLAAFYIRDAVGETLEPYAVTAPAPSMVAAGPKPTAARFETGTRNFEAYAGWVATLDYLETLGTNVTSDSGRPAPGRASMVRAMEAIAQWEGVLTRYMDARLAELPRVVQYRQDRSDGRERLGVFTVNVEGQAPIEVARALAADRIEAVCGHSGGVRAMQRLAGAFGSAAVRLSLAHYSGREDLDRALTCLLQCSR